MGSHTNVVLCPFIKITNYVVYVDRVYIGKRTEGVTYLFEINIRFCRIRV